MPFWVSESKQAVTGTWEIFKLENVPPPKGKYKTDKSKQPVQSKQTIESKHSAESKQPLQSKQPGQSKQHLKESQIKCQNEETSLNGTIFTLHQNGTVTWHKSPQGVSGEDFPLLDANAYYMSTAKAKKEQIEFNLPFDESIKFISSVVDDNLILVYSTYHIYCRKVEYLGGDNFGEITKYSLFDGYQESSFADYEVTTCDGKLVKLDKCLLTAFFPQVDIQSSPLELLSSDALIIFVEYIYKGAIPKDANIESIYALKSFCDQRPEFGLLSESLKEFIRGKAARDRILGLINDCQTRTLKIASIINNGNPNLDTEVSRTHLSNPLKMAEVLKECCTEILIGSLIQLQMLYLFGSKNMSKNDSNELMKEMITKGEEVCGSIHKTLKVLYKHLNVLTDDEVIAICHHCQPQLLKFISDFGKLSSGNIEQFMKEVIDIANKKYKDEKLKKSSSKIAFALKSAIRLKEIYQLRELESNINHTFVYITQKSEVIMEKDDEEKLEFLEQIIEEDLPHWIRYFENLKNSSSHKRNKRMISSRKKMFQLYTSYIRWFIDTVAENKDEIQPLIIKTVQELTGNLEIGRLVNELLELASKPKNKTEELKRVNTNSGNLFILQRKIQHLYDTKEQSDLVFHITGPISEQTGYPSSPVVIKSHRIIVSCRCMWFRRALSSGMRESIERRFEIVDTSPQLFEMFLKYLYTLDINFDGINTENMTELVTIADKYEHDELKDICERHLTKYHINDDSAAYLLVFADKMNAEFLKCDTLRYIDKHPECLDAEDMADLPDYLKKEIKKQRSFYLPLPNKLDKARDTICESDSSSVTSDSDMPNENFEAPSTSEASSRSAPSGENNSLQECIETLRNVIPAPYEELMRLALAADNDSTRALNFYFGDQ